jgi:hypothetical protein
MIAKNVALTLLFSSLLAGASQVQPIMSFSQTPKHPTAF